MTDAEMAIANGVGPDDPEQQRDLSKGLRALADELDREADKGE